MLRSIAQLPAGKCAFFILNKVPVIKNIISVADEFFLTRPVVNYLKNLSFGKFFVTAVSLNSFGNALVASTNAATTPSLHGVNVKDLHYSGPVTVLIPARNEEHRISKLIGSLQNQVGLSNLTVVVIDDNSTDSTARVVQEYTEHDPRFIVHTVTSPPHEDWLGKPAALEEGRKFIEQTIADPGILILIDADVYVEPEGLVRSVVAFEQSPADLVTIWPQQEAQAFVEDLFQPMLSWIWMAWAPRFVSRIMPKMPLMTVTMGQFIMLKWEVYQAVGGHYAVRNNPLEDLYFGRSFRRKGYLTDCFFAGKYIRCRMYESWHEIHDGYTRWLHVLLQKYQFAFFGPVLALLSVLGPSWVLKKGLRHWGYLCYASQVVSRLSGNYATKTLTKPKQILSALLHPFTIMVTLYLITKSHWLALHDRVVWKGRIISQTGSIDLPTDVTQPLSYDPEETRSLNVGS